MITRCNERHVSARLIAALALSLLYLTNGFAQSQKGAKLQSSDICKPTLSFYSRATGSWETTETWSNTGHNGNPASTIPTSSDMVFIGDGINYHHVIRVTFGSAKCAGLSLAAGSTLDLGVTKNNVFNVVNSGSHGNLKISSSGTTAEFPSGNFSTFLGTDGGQVEYYTTGNQSYTLPAATSAPNSTPILSYCYLKFSPSSSKDIQMANTNLIVYKNMIVAGTEVTDRVKLNNTDISSLTIKGHLFINSGGLQFQNFNNKALSMIVDSNIMIAAGASFDLEHTGPGANNTLTIGGSLYNNGIFDMSFSQAQRAYPVSFNGAANAVIAGSGSVTDFFAITVNKGNSQTPVLEVISDNFTFSNNTNPLTITNGTFKVTSPVTISISDNDFIIPPTACLAINGGFVTAGSDTNSNANIKLSGKIAVSGGLLNIGKPGSAYGNSILYTGADYAELDISGGTLTVNGQICRETVSGSIKINYRQTSNSVVTIKGIAPSQEKAKLEIMNPGSNFYMSGGILNIENGGSQLFHDLYLAPESFSVSGGTLVFGNQNTLTQNQFNLFRLYADCPVFNLTIDGTTTAKTVGVTSPELTIAGDITIETPSIFKSNGAPISIEGN